uniref:Uncharacterized protein n=1 Tax=Romanomermis culicivorax TaxID=13658 RepID=A0A915LBR0_ROMCU
MQSKSSLRLFLGNPDLTILRNRDFQEKALKHSSGKRNFEEWGFTQINDQHECQKEDYDRTP